MVSQPLRFRFDTAAARDHTPDFLAVTPGDLADRRPAGRADRGRGPGVVRGRGRAGAGMWVAIRGGAGWRDHVLAGVDGFSSQRRPLSDPSGRGARVLAGAVGGRGFGELAESSAFPPVARAHLLHLLWHRRLGLDLRWPLGDRSIVMAAEPMTAGAAGPVGGRVAGAGRRRVAGGTARTTPAGSISSAWTAGGSACVPVPGRYPGCFASSRQQRRAPIAAGSPRASRTWALAADVVRAAAGAPAGGRDRIPRRGQVQAGPGEPKPEYDPDSLPSPSAVWRRSRSCKALDRVEARLLGLDRVGLRTLIRWEKARQAEG